MKKILVFASKEIGHRLILFLKNNFPSDEYDIVCTNPEKNCLVGALARDNIKARPISNDVINNLKSQACWEYDWLLNLWGSYIFDDALLAKCKNTLNIHPSMLPYGRGRDPVVWALRTQTPAGVTLHQINKAIDAGPIWCQEEVHYDFPCKGKQFYDQIIKKSYEIFCKNWKDLRSGLIAASPQADLGQKTYVRADLLNDRVIHLSGDTNADEFISKVLSHDSGPNYSAILLRDHKRFVVHLSIEELNSEGGV